MPKSTLHTVILFALSVLLGFFFTQAILASALSLRGLHSSIQWQPNQLNTLHKKTDLLILDIKPIPPDIQLEHYNRLSIRGARLDPTQMSFKITQLNGITQELNASTDSTTEHVIFPLASTGTLHALQLTLHGERHEGSSILHIDLEPHPASFSLANLHAGYKALWQAWLSREGLNVYSAHFVVGGEKASYISSPSLAGVLWLVLSVLFGWVLTRRHATVEVQLTALALLILLIWSLVDLRWQRDLWLEHSKSIDTSASAATHAIDLQAERIQRVLPKETQRVFILSAKPFDRLRLRYALLPHNSHAEAGTLEQLSPQLHRDDHLVLVLPLPGINTNLAHNQIYAGTTTLEVKALLAEARLAVVKVLAVNPNNAKPSHIPRPTDLEPRP
jgi:hypothetical protein